MKRQNVRVIVASEYPEAQYFLRTVVEKEVGATTVGQAQDTFTALTLARNLRPDVAIIDCYLPHAVGLDTIPLSRIGGLDIAQSISEEIPNIRVILLNNLDTVIFPDSSLSSDVDAIYSVGSKGTKIPLALQDLCHEGMQPNALVFANVEAKPRASLRQKVTSLSGKDVLFSGLVILGGLSLILALVLAEAWVILALAGAVTIGFGIGLLWEKAKLWKLKRRVL